MQQQPLEQRSKCNSTSATDAPTHTDVLLGRGVSTNRHPGNENFREIVSRHVEAYVTSTKKQKMNTSKSIFEQVHKLNPPGRFLEKNIDTGLWQEVNQKRALEKTAQALRDGAAPLRKRMAKDLSIILFPGSDKKAATSPIVSSLLPSFSKNTVYHQGPPSKKLRTTSSVISSPVVEVLQSSQQNQRTQLQHHNWGQPLSVSSSSSLQENQLCINRLDTRYNEDQKLAQVLSYTFMQQISALQKEQISDVPPHIFDSSLASMTTSSKAVNVAANVQLIQDKNAIDAAEFAREMGPDEYFFDLCHSDPISVFDGGNTNIFDSFDGIVSDGSQTSMASSTTGDSPSMTGSEDGNAADDVQLTQDYSAIADEEFALEVGSDEHFFDLYDSCDITIFNSFDGILDD